MTDKEKLVEIKEICRNYGHYMWAAKILGIILECDFRDIYDFCKKDKS